MMVSQWFFTVGPLVSMVFQWFLMVANHWSNDGMVTIYRYGLQYMLNIAQCTCTHLLKGRAHIKWSKNLQISWQSYRYHQYPKHIPSYLEPLLTYADNMTELCVDLRYFFYDVDSKIVIYPNTGFIGFLVETFQGFYTHLCQWMVGKQPLVSMVFGLANHW